MREIVRELKTILFIVPFGLLSCASIPKEAPILSQELGRELQELERSHIKLVESFFDLKRKNVRNYIDTVWLPTYAEVFFSKPEISQMWEQVAATGSEHDRLKFLLITAPELQSDINQQYQQAIEPLNQLENKLTGSLREKYMNTRGINNTLTSFLLSASEVDQNKQRYLSMAGMTEDKFSGILEQTESITSTLVSTAVDVESKYPGVEKNIKEYSEKLKNLLNRL